MFLSDLPLIINKERPLQGKIEITAFFSVLIIYSKCSAGNAGDGISETLNLKTFWETCPQTHEFGVPSAL